MLPNPSETSVEQEGSLKGGSGVYASAFYNSSLQLISPARSPAPSEQEYPDNPEATSTAVSPNLSISPSKSLRFRVDERPEPSRSSSMIDMKDFGVAPNGALVASSRRRMRSRHSSTTMLSSGGTESSTLSMHTSSDEITVAIRKPRPSTRLKHPIDKPWLDIPDRTRRWSNIIFGIFILLGLGIAGYMCYQGYSSIQHPGKLCLLMEDDFSQGFRSDYYNHEVQVGGYGNGEFEWTTTSSNNTFVQDGVLYLVPTLTESVIGSASVNNGYTLNLTADGTCTGTNTSQCVQVSNSTLKKIINPVQSARLNTLGKFNITYGKVEVEARMPLGDWIWPAIWMLPVDNKYGPWPMSGEIDLAEARGNNFSYGYYGLDYIQSTLHWGPTTFIDSWQKTSNPLQNKIAGFHSDYHKYTLEWTEDYLATYVDNRVYDVLYLKLKQQTFWSRGNYPAFWNNGTLIEQIVNPWFQGTQAAPFDQSFYLLLNVAVGGTNGFFPDGIGGKPWIDSSPTAMSDFWAAKNQWYPTWPTDPTQRGMAIKSVKMWQKC